MNNQDERRRQLAGAPVRAIAPITSRPGYYSDPMNGGKGQVQGRGPVRRPAPAPAGEQLSRRGGYGDRVTVTISAWKCPQELLRRAVRSILDQSYENLRLVVVGDGDRSVLQLESDEDPRLEVYVLPHNRGQFFAHELVARASSDPFFCVQDADDWSDPTRLEEQVRLLVEKEADLALTSTIYHDGGAERRLPPSVHAMGELPSLGLHTGMYRRDALLAVGGYFWGERVGADTLVLLNVRQHGRVVAADLPLYHYERRADSMTSGGATPSRADAGVVLREIHRTVKKHTRASETRRFLHERTPDALRTELAQHVHVLGQQLAGPTVEVAPEPLRVVIAASPGVSNGGIVRHMDLMGQALRSVGHQVVTRRIESTSASLPDCDAVIYMGWFHGVPNASSSGDGARMRDWNRLRETAVRAREANVPLIVNSTWDCHPARSAWLRQAAEAAELLHPLCRFVAWSPAVWDDPELEAVRHLLVVVPQPVAPHRRAAHLITRPMSDRNGVCVGELGKLSIDRFRGNLDVELLGDLLQERLPGVELVGYDHYVTNATRTPPTIRLERPDPARFQEWLGRFRVCLSLAKHESFSRVPAEAQALGVPVVYRPMSQSLTPRIGLCGFPRSSEVGLADAVATAYQDETTWNALHQSGLHIAADHSDELVGIHWQTVIHNLRRDRHENHRPGS